MRLSRFAAHAAPHPGEIWTLKPDHPAMQQNRTLFPTTVVDPKESPRLLVSGFNQRKLGARILKGPWRGLPIYTLTLEERASCPISCLHLADCYGNAMHLARRHRHGPDLVVGLLHELVGLAAQHPGGFAVRLHVLGDFWDTGYVEFWSERLAQDNKLHVFGFTAHHRTSDIGRAVNEMNRRHPRQSAIRFSQAEPGHMASIVIDAPSEVPPGAIVCPAQQDRTDNCGTCGLCWSSSFASRTVAFLRHGPIRARGPRDLPRGEYTELLNQERLVMSDVRQITALPMPQLIPAAVGEEKPTFTWVDPRTLYVEETYQRDLSERSISLIRKIVSNWSWAAIKPPVVARDETGRMVVVDGQHTAIAAASHGGIPKIPVMLVPAGDIRSRARAFIGHNTDRLVPTQMQLFYASVEAGDEISIAVIDGARRAGVRIRRSPPPNGMWKPGDTIAIAALRKLAEAKGKAGVARVLKLLLEADRAPIRADDVKAVAWFLYDREGRQYDEYDLGTVIRSKSADEWLRAAKDLRAETPMATWRALAELWVRRLRKRAA